jgi:hypothetical protein
VDSARVRVGVGFVLVADGLMLLEPVSFRHVGLDADGLLVARIAHGSPIADGICDATIMARDGGWRH